MYLERIQEGEFEDEADFDQTCVIFVVTVFNLDTMRLKRMLLL